MKKITQQKPNMAIASQNHIGIVVSMNVGKVYVLSLKKINI
jgi:hypothetical protein